MEWRRKKRRRRQTFQAKVRPGEGKEGEEEVVQRVKLTQQKETIHAVRSFSILSPNSLKCRNYMFRIKLHFGKWLSNLISLSQAAVVAAATEEVVVLALVAGGDGEGKGKGGFQSQSFLLLLQSLTPPSLLLLLLFPILVAWFLGAPLHPCCGTVDGGRRKKKFFPFPSLLGVGF